MLNIYNKAKESLDTVEISLNESADLAIPGYFADKLPFAAYEEDKFAVLFVDMRRLNKEGRANRKRENLFNDACLSADDYRWRSKTSWMYH